MSHGYSQLNSGSRVQLIDDFHKEKLNKAGQNEFLDAVQKRFGKVIRV
jgi:hypothetical protein